MDSLTQQLVELAHDTRYHTLGTETVHECKRRLLDTIACAMGSFGHPLSVSMRELASHYHGTPGAGIWGTTSRTTPEMAAFVNGVMLRVGENSDTYIGKGGGGHPSDMIAGMVAAADACGANGRALVEAVVIGYDVYCRLMDAVNLGDKGFDQAVHVVLGTVLGAGKLFGLTAVQMHHAVALAIAPNMALRQTRHGQLSHWKGCAGANAVRNAVFAATLAQRGVEGPSSIFDGKQGLWSVTGNFEWPALEVFRSQRMVTRTSIKPLPVCYHTQSAALAALELHTKLNPGEVDDIYVETYKTAVDMAAGDAGQWTPRTPESADHSLPFVVATALERGRVEPNCFHADELYHPGVLRLMAKVRVAEDQALSRLWPESAAARVTVRGTSGREVSSEVLYPKGHILNPMSDAEISAKFVALFGPRSGASACDRALKALWEIDELDDLNIDLLSALALQAA
jgi:2-methylcitrate dehydratase